MIKPTTNAALALRPATSNFVACNSIRPAILSRAYATQNTQQTGLGATTIGPKRHKVTAFNDDGYVPWNQLSAGEKAARASQQTYNLGMILVGVVLTVCGARTSVDKVFEI
jgi:import inner membrane translocase subunit TIM21